MADQFEIINKVAESTLRNFDISTLVPKGERMGIDMKDFLWEGLVLKEKDFRQKIENINPEDYQNSLIYIFNSTEAIIPLWAYFLLTSKLQPLCKKIVFGDRRQLETLILQEAISTYDFTEYKDQKVLVKGCSEIEIPENAYIELVAKLTPLVQSLMFGEACSFVPIFKRKK